jgi:membrane protease subunit HflK
MMQSVLGGSSKVMVDQKAGSNLLYLPLDKLMQQSGVPGTGDGTPVPRVSPTPEPAPPAATSDPSRTRDGMRSRER